MLYIINDESFDKDGYEIKKINNFVTRIDMNVIYPTEEFAWNGNTKLYYKILKKMYASHATIQILKHNIKTSIKLPIMLCNLCKIYCIRYLYKIVTLFDFLWLK